ncbi:S-layer homology domain-containing protein [Ammoniphilus sp. CFH 90114]|uniref:S-layer homology domain-containing protein n=1 Tax=Ammoniphilus sp. CFH 90114 TaxID=2493665 RepID=UPI00100ED071|nr:S-layer homology domain-containing protein [Ammoniphilus sp. CFH 90114]RXT03686.1 hypothetical protein EIZ39_23455 [Ammoniphilus sp. CFH 90114]
MLNAYNSGLIYRFLFVSFFLFFLPFAHHASVLASTVSVTSVKITPDTVPLLEEGKTVELKAIVSPPEANSAVKWTSTNPAVAKVDSEGVVTPITAGTTTIIVSTVEGGKTDFREIKVYGPVKDLELSPPTLNLTSGGPTGTLTAAVKPANATNQQVNWVSTNRAVADVDQKGVVTPFKAGKTMIIATTAEGGITKTSEVTVTGVAVERIELNRTSLSTFLNSGTTTLTATVTPADATNRSVTWSTSDAAVARVNNGVITPVAPGRATITATTDSGRKTATCEVTVLSHSGQASGLKVRRTGTSRVELTWSGTSGDTYVEIRRGNSKEDDEWTRDRSASFSGLSYDTRYDVYINDRYVDDFRIRDLVGNVNVQNFRVNPLSSTKVELTWTGTSGTVYVELTDGSRDDVEEYSSTSNRAITFSGLSPNTTYNVYIEGVYVDRFKLSQDIRDFKVKSKTESTAEFTWQGSTGTVRVELRDASNRTLFEKSTSGQSISFSGLTDNTEYRVYVDGTYIQAIRTDLKDKVTNFSVRKDLTKRSVLLQWRGTTGTVEVVLKTGNQIVKTTPSSNFQASFTNLVPNQDYAVYINDRYMENFSLILSDTQAHWAKAAINRLFENGIVSGYENGTFLPEKTVNREEFVTMLVKAKGYTLQAGQGTFNDIPTYYWAASFIQTAIAQGIIVPSEFGSNFQPRKPITREEMAVMIARAMKLTGDASALSFSDQNQIKNKTLIGAVVQSQIITGYPDQTFRPNGVLNRAEAATVINKIY